MYIYIYMNYVHLYLYFEHLPVINVIKILE